MYGIDTEVGLAMMVAAGVIVLWAAVVVWRKSQPSRRQPSMEALVEGIIRHHGLEWFDPKVEIVDEDHAAIIWNDETGEARGFVVVRHEEGKRRHG